MGVEHSKPVRLAHAALAAAIDGKWRRAEELITRINTECAGPGLGDSLVAWCDAMQEHATDGDMSFQKIRTVTMAIETGEMDHERAKTPHMDWVRNLLTARSAGDRDTFVALLEELNSVGDGWERGRYVGQLVESVALSIRSLPRGYATMGRSDG